MIIFFSKTENFYANKVEKRFLKISNILFKTRKNDEYFFWKKINEIKSDGYYITTFNSSGLTLRYGRKPYILNTTMLDIIPYIPYQVTEVKLIIEDIYGIPFNDPPIKFLGAILDDWFKNTFEKRSINDWKLIAEKYNISGVIVPSDWNLIIKDKIVSQKFTAYILN